MNGTNGTTTAKNNHRGAHKLLLASLLTMAFPVAAVAGPAFLEDAEPFGKSYRDWAAEWTQWSYSIPASVHPLADVGGDYCAVGQRGRAWFLGGTFGGAATRICTIPAETGVFFPIITLACDNVGANPPLNIAGLRNLCASYLQSPVYEAQLDGVAINNLNRYRVRSSVFSYSVSDDNLYGYPPGVVYPSVADGYFLMLKPLSPGQHTLHIHGGLPQFGFDVDVTYVLNVVPLIDP